MPTVLSHPAVPLALGLGLGSKAIPKPFLAAGALAAILPDLDVIGFRLGIPYGAGLGHRGFSHSVFLALGFALLGGLAFRIAKHRFGTAFSFLFFSMLSHGLLDAFTTGGKGIALLWPFTLQRFFAPWQVIEVSPLSLSRFLSGSGAAVMVSELIWVWFPMIALALGLKCLRDSKPALFQNHT